MKLYPKSWSGFAFAILRIAAAVYLAVLGLLFFCQKRVIFIPTQLAAGYQFQFKHSFEEKIVEVAGKKIDSLLFKVPDCKGLILYFHGNAGNLAGWGQVAQEISDETAMSVWIMDYPGYGKSEGQISSEAQLHSVAAAFMDSANQLAGPKRIIIYGRSIGTGLAVKLASEYKNAALILESPYFTLQNMAYERFPWAPLFLLKYSFHSDLWMPKVESPVLIFHGDEDEVIPFSQGQKLAELARHKTFVAVHKGHHNDLSDFSEYWISLNQFLLALK